MYPLNIKRLLVRTYRMHIAVDILFIRTDIIVKIRVARRILSGAIGPGLIWINLPTLPYSVPQHWL